jgi:uncharacterized SAM-binding protein YcdF (DUF218 family)
MLPYRTAIALNKGFRTYAPAISRLAACLVFLTTGLVLAWRFYDPAIELAYARLEHRFSQTLLQDHDRIAGFIVLGGTPGRIEEAAKLAARFQGVPVIVSGDREQVAANANAALAGRFVMDPRPKNTFENALYSKELANARTGERWILVTSAFHMPRAIGAFRAVGFAVEPWPVPENTSRTEKEAWLFHEIVGLVVYRILGRSQAFYPGP